MKLKDHLARKLHDSKQVPLWKWLIIIFLAIAMPLFFSFARNNQTEQVIENQ